MACRSGWTFTSSDSPRLTPTDRIGWAEYSPDTDGSLVPGFLTLAGRHFTNATLPGLLLIGVSMLVVAAGVAGQPAYDRLADVRADADSDRIPDAIGETIRIRAVAVSDPFAVQPAPLFRIYLADSEAGAMMQTTDAGLIQDIRAGDELVVTGTIEFYAGSPMIAPATVVILGPGEVPAPEPATVADILAEAFEGQLVSVRGTLVNAQNVELVDRTGAVRVRARREILEEPGFGARYRSESLVEVIGIASQFDPSAPHDGGYRLELLSADGIVLRTDYRPFLWTLAVLALIAVFWWRARKATQRAAYTQHLLDQVSASEEALKDSEVRLRIVAEATSDVIWELDLARKELFWGAGAAELFQVETDTRIPNRTSHFDFVDESDKDRLRGSLARAIAEGAATWEDEYRIVRRDGAVRQVSDSARLIKGEDGVVQRIIGSIVDITDRRAAEERERELQARVQHAQRLESLGILSSGIAHDFNNILAAISGSAELLGESGSVTGSDHALVEEIKTMSRRGVDLTNKMLTYAGRAPTERKPVDLNRVVDDMVAVLSSVVSRKVVLDRSLEPELPPVDGDEAQLQQVVMNFISNAIDSLPGGRGRVTIRTAVSDVESPPGSLIGDGLAPGEYVSLEIADNGAGIDAADRDKIFEPFYTTKSTGRGLGLSAVLGIIKSHDGCLFLDSEFGQGTTFTTLFPIGTGTVSTVTSRAAAPQANFSGARVLIADDEELVAQFTARALEALNLVTDIVYDGQSAVDRVLNTNPGYDLIILDVSMPGLSGDEAYDRIRQAGIDVPVLFISGHGVYDLEQRLPSMARVAILAKPFAIDDFRSQVAELLTPHEEAVGS